MEQYKQDFIDFMLDSRVLKFGDFTLKSGRKSPFFMNAGAYQNGGQLIRLGEYYARAIHDTYGLDFDILFGLEHHYGSGKEVLTYGIDLDFLLAHPNIDVAPIKDYCDAVHEAGGFISQAHFSTFIKRYTGRTPCEIRNGHFSPTAIAS